MAAGAAAIVPLGWCSPPGGSRGLSERERIHDQPHKGHDPRRCDQSRPSGVHSVVARRSPAFSERGALHENPPVCNAVASRIRTSQWISLTSEKGTLGRTDLTATPQQRPVAESIRIFFAFVPTPSYSSPSLSCTIHRFGVCNRVGGLRKRADPKSGRAPITRKEDRRSEMS